MIDSDATTVAPAGAPADPTAEDAAQTAAPAVAPVAIAVEPPAARDWTPEDRVHEVRSWLEPRLWPTPAWAARPRRIGPRYEAQLLQLARARYLELETDFRTLFAARAADGADSEPGDVVTGQCVLGLLHGARQGLEMADVDLAAVSAALDLAERCLLWATPAPLLAARVPGVRRRLEREVGLGGDRDRLLPLVRRLGALEGAVAGRGVGLPELRAAMDEGLAALHAAVVEREGQGVLRLERLYALRDRALLLLGTSVALLPMLLPARAPAGAVKLAVPFVLRHIPIAASDAWMAGTAVALCGAAGGFLSGLLRTRLRPATAAEQLEGVLRLELRAAVGALVAVAAFVLLSWGVLPGLAVVSGGFFLAMAFGVGFAERIFLRRLDADEPAAPAAAAARVERVERDGFGGAERLGGRPGGAPAYANGGRVAAALDKR
ncbi:hypothetical protein [Roseisolibacter sp. H3M3-2]|uniref:hypothetical protein n=1 Tax=Roseisolibacter sp. H3M3-2 TaxID=3031323 RepID=UPI0023DA8B36|nr:hypothetical protein [Roseisolibacter sp. H3M3-2]MDF1504445.1 hypothetical protein [Roseisolibacter sp. H3M3-2]